MLLGVYDFTYHPNKTISGRARKFLRDIVRFLGDFGFFIVFACMIAVINYTYNDGSMRIYTPICILIGYFLYRSLIGRVVNRVIEWIVYSLKRTISFIFSIIFYPFRRILFFLIKKAKNLFKKIYKSLEKMTEKVYNSICKVGSENIQDRQSETNESKKNRRRCKNDD